MEIKRVLGDRVLVYLDPPIKEIGGIFITSISEETNQWGIATDTGPKCKYVKIGDHVMCGAHSGTRFKKGDSSILIIREGDVLCIEED